MDACSPDAMYLAEDTAALFTCQLLRFLEVEGVQVQPGFWPSEFKKGLQVEVDAGGHSINKKDVLPSSLSY